MNRSRIGACLVFPACLLLCSLSGAESGVMDRLGGLFDDVARGLRAVGEKSEILVEPVLPPAQEGGQPAYSVSRTVIEHYPVEPGAAVSIQNEFGRIDVAAWENPVVGVSASLTAAADTAAAAARLSEAIEIRIVQDGNRIAVETVYPEPQAAGKTFAEVNYEVRVPRDAALTCDNYFGDTRVRGLGGALTLRARYGLVEVQDVEGPVDAQVRGEFPLRASGLRQGGAFTLHDAPGTFSDVGGPLTVSAFRGGVEVRGLAPDADVTITNEGGPIVLHVAEESVPDIAASVLSGAIVSELPVERSERGDRLHARSRPAEPTQRLDLFAAFNTVEIRRERREPTVAEAIIGAEGEVLTREPIPEAVFEVAEDTPLMSKKSGFGLST